MYQYEDGVKKKNVGYARVESRNGQCRVTLHMQLLGLMDGVFPTYMIQRKDNDMDLIYLGDSILKNQVMDCRLITKASNIGDSGYGLSEMGGILLFLNEKVFYATQWDDKPIVLEKVLEALEEKKEVKKEQVEAKEEKLKEEKLPDVKDIVKDKREWFFRGSIASNIIDEKEWSRDYMLRTVNKIEKVQNGLG